MLELFNPFNNCQGFTFRDAVVSFGGIQLPSCISYDYFSSVLLLAKYHAYGIIACIGGQLKRLREVRIGKYWSFSEGLL